MKRLKPTNFQYPETIEELPFPIAEPGNLQQVNAGFRTQRPVIDNDKCIECMMCYLLCPDGAIYRKEGKLIVDYDYCKGCGICAHECKLGAFTMIREE